jgi:mono/diheme cytochrome c family protein
LPIGIWILVALGELASLSPRLKARVDPALALALPVLLLTTVTAFVLGHLLGKAGGFPPHALTLHRRLELFATLGTALCLLVWSYQARHETNGARWAYRGLLGASIALLSIGAHFGGTLTRGDAYLAKYAPGFLKPLLGGEEPVKAPPKPSAQPPSAEPLLYANVVQPLFDKYCTECHYEQKRKGKLRLDTLAQMLKGGENGPVIVAGSSESSMLVKRMLLPTSDDDHMPPADEAQPTADEIAVLRFWIDRGAGDALRVRDLLVPDGARKVLLNAIAQSPAPAERLPEPKASDRAAPEPKASDRAAPEPSEPKTEKATPEQPSTAEPERPVARAPNGSAILEAKCSKCHGPNKQKAKLRVDSLAALLRGGKSGPALIAGSPEKSSIIQRVKLPLSDDKHMPPEDEPQLDATEIAALTAWVRSQSASRLPPVVAEAPSDEPVQSAADTAAEPAAETESAAEPLAASVDSGLLASLPPKVVLWTDAVHPILMDKCGKCHGGAAPKAALDVSSIEKLKTGGWSGPAIVPGKPSESLALQRSKLPETDDDRMPPPGEVPIKQGEIDLVEAWVALGAAADTTAETKALSAPALEVLSATLRAPRASAAEHEKVEASAGGCAACTIGDARHPPFTALLVSLLATAALLLRRWSAAW